MKNKISKSKISVSSQITSQISLSDIIRYLVSRKISFLFNTWKSETEEYIDE